MMELWFLCAGLLVPAIATAEVVGGGNLVYTPKDAFPIVFSHENHVNGGGMKCSTCHYQIFQMAKGTWQMRMEKIRSGEFCGKCHNGTKAFDAKATAYRLARKLSSTSSVRVEITL